MIAYPLIRLSAYPLIRLSAYPLSANSVQNIIFFKHKAYKKEKNKKRDAFKRAAVLITAALLATGLLLTACPTPAPDTPAPPEYTAVAYGENGQGLKEYLNGLPEGDTLHGIEVMCVSEAAIKGEPGVPGEPTTTGPSPLGSIIKASGKKVALKLPADISKISGYAFYQCSGLVEVKLPKNLTLIEIAAFAQCPDLKTVDLSGCTRLTSIGEAAFISCFSLESVNFSGCTALTKIVRSAFAACKKIGLVDLSGCTSLDEIGATVFGGSSNAKVKLPASITKINEQAFGNAEYPEFLCAKVLIPKSKYDVIKGLVTAASFPEDRIEQYED